MTRNWTRAALCANGKADPEVFFPASYLGHVGNLPLRTARAWCLACPARQTCLAEALAEEAGRSAESRHGVRGALTPAERHQLDKPQHLATANCGTVPGFRAHRDAGEEPCDPCLAAEDARLDRLAQKDQRPACGTDAGYQRHMRLRTKACDQCRAARAAKRQQERATTAA